jgi:S-adenosylmethionine:tRNA ribosyltransferase-isomerase
MSKRARGSRTADYDYDLPPDRIAQRPARRRDWSRLLVLHRESGATEHLRFHQIIDLIPPGDALVLNETRVLHARLIGRKPTGAPAEILLLHPANAASAPPPRQGEGETGRRGELHRTAPPPRPGDGETGRRGGPPVPAPSRAEMRAGGRARGDPQSPRLPVSPSGRGGEEWYALVRPGSKLKPGRVVDIADDLRVEILDSTPDGGRIVRLDTRLSGDQVMARYGHMPLPPYIQREADARDERRYQTVYARTRGSVAAPTAGLHFTPALLERLEGRGVHVVRTLLHVGIGTFRPVDVEDPAKHAMHEERYDVSEQAAGRLNAVRAAGGHLWAVGTTVTRTLETVVDERGVVHAGSGWTDLFIRPPYRFRAVDRLVTNFHLPRSTLLMLVSAFGGYDAVMAAYRVAVAESYRFYSYGDAMAVV